MRYVYQGVINSDFQGFAKQIEIPKLVENTESETATAAQFSCAYRSCFQPPNSGIEFEVLLQNCWAKGVRIGDDAQPVSLLYGWKEDSPALGNREMARERTKFMSLELEYSCKLRVWLTVEIAKRGCNCERV